MAGTDVGGPGPGATDLGRWLPDFHAPTELETSVVYAAFQRPGHFLAYPRSWTLARRPDSTPDLRVQEVRGPDPARPPTPHTEFDVSFVLPDVTEEALGAVRLVSPLGLVQQGVYTDGTLDWRMLGSEPTPAALPELPLAWSGLMATRLRARLDPDTGALARAALALGALSILARGSVELQGVAPRLPLRVQFSPQELAGLLGRPVGADVTVTWEALVSALNALPGERFTPAGPGLSEERGEVLADWVRACWGHPATPPSGETRPCVGLNLTGPAANWDLSTPLVSFRPLLLLAPLRTRPEDAATFTAPPLIVPALDHGQHALTVRANLPAHRSNLLAASISVRQGPLPPARPQAVTLSQDLSEPDDTVHFALQLAPGEPLNAQFRAEVVFQTDAGVTRLLGDWRPLTTEDLTVGPASFPVRFASLELAPALAALCSVDATLHWTSGPVAFNSRVTLTALRPVATLAVGLEARDLTWSVWARAHDPDSVVQSASGLAAHSRLSASCLPGNGRQQVQITAELPDPRSLLRLELRPEGQADDQISLSVLSRALTSTVYSYLSRDAFHPRFQYRTPGPLGPGRWSALLNPGAALRLRLTPDQEVQMIGTETQLFEGLRWERDPTRPDAVQVAALDLSPQRDDSGEPSLTLLSGAQGGTLMCATQWSPGPEALTHLKASLESSPEGPVSAVLVTQTEAQQAVLELRDGPDAEWQSAAQATPSPQPPHSALFSAQLSLEELNLVLRALGGQSGTARIRYVGRLPGGAVQVRLHGSPPPGPITPDGLLAEAQNAHGLHLDVQAPPGTPDAALGPVRRDVAEQAARMLSLTRLDQIDFSSSAALPGTPWSPTTDLSTWLSETQLTEHVRQL